MAGYNGQCIPNFPEIAFPLPGLTTKGAVFQWGHAEQTAFDHLCHAVAQHPVLAYPDPTGPDILYTDASD